MLHARARTSPAQLWDVTAFFLFFPFSFSFSIFFSFVSCLFLCFFKTAWSELPFFFLSLFLSLVCFLIVFSVSLRRRGLNCLFFSFLFFFLYFFLVSFRLTCLFFLLFFFLYFFSRSFYCLLCERIKTTRSRHFRACVLTRAMS